jgi:ABC-type transport system involved in multi-copper enzyme maturation permease subunit
MMTQTLALFLDAYRELHAKKMFWIVLALNILFIAVFALLGVNDHGMTILWFQPFEDSGGKAAALFYYKRTFSIGVVGIWLTWAATILALASTSGIFPDFLSSGAIDLFLAKPIRRVRLFFTKYAAALLFVLLQVTIFSVLAFLVLGLRAGLWEPGLFWAIPLVLLFFSYIYSICVLLGVLTRSTVAALLLTILAWFFIWSANSSEGILTGIRIQKEMQRADLEDRLESLDHRIAQAQLAAGTQSAQTQTTAPASAPRVRPSWLPDFNRNATLPELQDERRQVAHEHDAAVVSPMLVTFEHLLHQFRTVVPKTGETTNLLDRVLFQDKELREMANPRVQSPSDEEFSYMNGPRVRAKRAEIAGYGRDRSVWWIIGTSLAFEAAILALGAWYFCTRDF